MAAHSTGECIKSAFPNEQIWIFMGGGKGDGFLEVQAGGILGPVYHKEGFPQKGIVSSAHFDYVWWLGYQWAISKYPKTFCTFITKQVSGWCSCNSKLSLWEENIINKCPQCGCNDKTSKHPTRCTDPGCVLQLHNLIEAIMDVLNEVNITSELADIIETYLLHQGCQTMEDCIKSKSKYVRLSTNINNLGWDCFVDGWLPHSLITTIKPMFHRYKPSGSIEIWGTKFIKSLISLTHKQWLYRICDLHYISDGLTLRQHDKLTSKIKELMKTKCTALLGRHWHFHEHKFQHTWLPTYNCTPGVGCQYGKFHQNCQGC